MAKSTRIILQDSRFGDLSYHKKIFNHPVTFPGTERLCPEPFMYSEVRLDGSVHICCPQWNPAAIGNVLKEDFVSIWNGEKAQIIRNSILDGSYSYCNSETCPKIQNWKNNLEPHTAENRDRLLNSVKDTPENVLFVVDDSCNLACPSCRGEKKTQLGNFQKEQALTVIRKVLRVMFMEPHLNHNRIGMDGSGEIFSSEVYRELFETEEIFTDTYKWPNLQFALNTNGTMMTEKIQKKYKHLMNQVSRIEISIDAGNQESYEKVRKGGHWELLWKNLDYFYSTIKDKKKTYWQWNIIVQADNFESIPELIALGNKYNEYRPSIYFAKVLNWGTWTDSEYEEIAVHLPTHLLHTRYLEIMNLPEVQNYNK